VLRFLLTTLNIEAILGETSLASRKKMLRKVATTGVGLDSVYDQTLQRIREQKGDRSRLGIEVLMWVSHAERPLRIDELCHALAVEIQSTDLDPENIRPQDTVLGSCLGLVVVDPLHPSRIPLPAWYLARCPQNTWTEMLDLSKLQTSQGSSG